MCNLYGKIGVYNDHGGIALARDEGRAIAGALGKDNMACILQNHGLVYDDAQRYSICADLVPILDSLLVGQLSMRLHSYSTASIKLAMDSSWRKLPQLMGFRRRSFLTTSLSIQQHLCNQL